MSEQKYAFQVGDVVRFQYEDIDVVCPIVRLHSFGGGTDKRDPLYEIRYEDGFPNDKTLAGLSRDRKQLPVHAMFLKLVQPYIPDIEYDSIAEII